MAPEQLKDARQTLPPGDLYALGATLHMLLIGRPIWSADNGDPLPTRIGRRLTDRPKLGFDSRPTLPPDLTRLMEQLLSADTRQRPTTEQVIQRLTPWCTASDLASLYGRASSTDSDGWSDSQRDAARHGPATPEIAAQNKTPIRLGTRVRVVAWAALVCVALGLVIHLAVPRGEIIITSDDPNVTVLVKLDTQPVGDGFVVGESKSVKWCRAGEYRIEIRGVDAADYEVRNGMFTLSRNGQAVVEIVRRSEAPDRVAAPMLPTDRRTALGAVLEHGGRIEFDGILPAFAAESTLPQEIPVVRNLTIRGKDWPGLTPEKLLALLAHIGPIQHGLWLDGVELDTRTMRRLGQSAPLAEIQLLTIGQCQLEDPGDLKGFRNLQGVGFPNTRLSDQGVRWLAALPGLRMIDLSATQVTDEGLLSVPGYQWFGRRAASLANHGGQLAGPGLHGVCVALPGYPAAQPDTHARLGRGIRHPADRRPCDSIRRGDARRHGSRQRTRHTARNRRHHVSQRVWQFPIRGCLTGDGGQHVPHPRLRCGREWGDGLSDRDTRRGSR